MKHITLAYNQGKSSDHIKILYSWFQLLPIFGLNITNVLKWGQNAKYSPV